jgi:hypothetical protein
VQRILGTLRRHPRIVGVGVLLAVGLGVFGFVWFEPHKLFLDERMEEALPGSASAAGGMEAGSSPAVAGAELTGPETLLSGPVEPANHGPASGEALVLELKDGRTFLRLEDLEVDNGPDLFVYLSAASEAEGRANEEVFLEDFLDLGLLKGNIGSSNYEIPRGTDLSRYRTVMIWCRRFTVTFAVASLR